MEATGDFELGETDVKHLTAKLSEVELHYIEAGPADGPLVILLHGFPEFWYSWRHQIPALAEAGYRVVAPDQRGYSTSDKPPGVANYHIRKLVNDVVELIDHLGDEHAFIVGHDWGAAVAWFLAMMHPDLVRKLAILNAPHPVAMWNGLRTLRQLRKSWYMAFFQLPWLAEKAIAARDYKALRDMMKTDPVAPGTFSDDDIERYIRTIADNNAMPTMLNWYRAARAPAKDLYRKIELSTLVIWGTSDVALGEELAEPPTDWVPNVRVERLNASHWVQCDAPDHVNALLLHYLAEP